MRRIVCDELFVSGLVRRMNILHSGVSLVLLLGASFLAIHFGLPVTGGATATDVEDPHGARGALGIPLGSFEAVDAPDEVADSIKENAREWEEREAEARRDESQLDRLLAKADAGDADAAVAYALAVVADTRNYGKGSTYLLKAAGMGSAEAMRVLGSWYELGSGGVVNLPKALAWYRLAQAKGWRDGDNVVALLEATMDPNGLRRARDLTHLYADRYGVNLSPPLQ